MNREFLLDYQANERSEHEHFLNKMKEEPEGIDRFPSLNRFNQLHDPVVIGDNNVYGVYKEKIWSQIPFAGTLVILLPNVKKEYMLTTSGFEVYDIPKLIDLAKETGRVQFCLTAEPLSYEGLDHLDPIFNELRPPTLYTMPMELFIDPKILNVWMEEFNVLSRLTRFNNFLKERYVDMGEQYIERERSHYSSTYVNLKLLNMNYAAEKIFDYMFNEPNTAFLLLTRFGELTRHYLDIFHASYNQNFHTMQLFVKISLAADYILGTHLPDEYESSKVDFPVEIGRFIMKKLALNPTTYLACVDVIEKYKQNDLYKVLESLHKGIKTKSKEVVFRDIKEIDIVMDNIWKDAGKLHLQKELIRNAMSISVGLIGQVASSILGGFGGLLAGLGFNVADRMLEVKNVSVSDKFVRLLNKDFVYNIYDFRKKHLLHE